MKILPIVGFGVGSVLDKGNKVRVNGVPYVIVNEDGVVRTYNISSTPINNKLTSMRGTYLYIDDQKNKRISHPDLEF